VERKQGQLVDVEDLVKEAYSVEVEAGLESTYDFSACVAEEVKPRRKGKVSGRLFDTIALFEGREYSSGKDPK